MSRDLIKSTGAVGTMTLVSRISGLVRDVVFANVIGDRTTADVFFVAFRIPNFFRRIFGEGAFSAAFVPIYTQYRENHTQQQRDSFVQLLIGRLACILLIFSALGIASSHWLISILAAGFFSDPQKFDLAVQASQITFPYIFFISLVAMSAGMLNACGRFAAPAATPVLLNLCLISSALWLIPCINYPTIALSIGVLLAGVLQLIFQIPFLRKEKITIRPRIRKRPEDEVGHLGVVKVFKLTVPAIFGVSVAQVNIMVNTFLASFLMTGSISWLYYSDRLMEFPVGVFGIALSTTILPDLSRKFSAASNKSFSDTLNWALRWVYLIAIPAAAALAVLSIPLVTTIYFHGDFTQKGVYMTAAALMAYSVGLLGIILVKVLAPGYFARQNTKTPVKVAACAMLVNIALSLILISDLRHVGLALATSLAAIFNALVLYVMLRKSKIINSDPGSGFFVFRVTLSTLVMSGVLWWMKGSDSLWLEFSVWERIYRLSSLVLGGVVVYFISLVLVGIKIQALWPSRKNKH